nr:CDS-5 [Gordionus sp. m RMFG-2023]
MLHSTILISLSLLISYFLFNLYKILFTPTKLKINSFSSSFECGIDTFGMSRMPYSLKFMYITILFIIFDLEIAIIVLLPLMKSFNEINFSVLMLLVLTVGITMEWIYNNINWYK